MDNYPNNSHAYKEQQKKAAANERPRAEKVISGTAQTKKKSEMSKIAEALIPGAGNVSNIGQYVLMDILVPTITNAVCDIITDSANMLFRGEKTRKREGRRPLGDHVSYNKFSDRRDDRSDSYRRPAYSPEDVTLDSRADAEMVLTHLDDMIDTYGQATVGDLYDLVGITGNYTDNKYGWTNLRNAEPIRLSSGKYLLRLPKAVPIDN